MRVGRPSNFILYLRKRRYYILSVVIPVDLWPVLLCFPLYLYPHIPLFTDLKCLDSASCISQMPQKVEKF